MVIDKDVLPDSPITCGSKWAALRLVREVSGSVCPTRRVLIFAGKPRSNNPAFCYLPGGCHAVGNSPALIWTGLWP